MESQRNPAVEEIGDEYIRWAYKLFFDREPENAGVIEVRRGMFENTVELRDHFMGSTEFMENQHGIPAVEGLRTKPPLSIEIDVDESSLEQMIAYTRSRWEKLGNEKPHWSVMSGDKFTPDSIKNRDGALETFYRSGQYDADHLILALQRNGIDLDSLATCMDYGCGLGRVTRWLSERFARVIGCDISTPHLQAAISYLEAQGVTNATFQPARSFEEIARLPEVDLLFSLIVLQHNPPPIMACLLKLLLGRIKSGGVGYIQIPVYEDGYSFSADTYLKNLATHEEIEMHILPQSKVFEIIADAGCRVLEVAPTLSAGTLYGLVSYAFLVRKG